MNELALTYFRSFSSKDLDLLCDLLHPTITLRDWVIEVKSRDNVLASMKDIFDQFATIQVVPLNVLVDGNTVIAELEITLDDELIKVVDIIEYSPDWKICAIRAYKG
jgi:ketosteroid isomerase-like protein